MLERRLITVEGIVQGVGFRPFIHGLATARNLRGFVRNDSSGVLIDLEGDREAVEDFLHQLTTAPPPLARIDSVCAESAEPRGYRDFAISPSDRGAERLALVSPDVATCDACLAELFDPGNRRYRYPFINCTNCGPRFTIVCDVPYDRPRTTMARFLMCNACRQEYEDPDDRRFHAQPVACWDCGPALELRDPRGTGRERVFGDAALAGAVEALRSGKIVAIKGLGGYHLACDTTSSAALLRLRARKHREAKPLAIMVADLETIEILCEIGEREAELLQSPQRPIVLVTKRLPCTVADEVAPRNRYLGVMLPYTPLHHLLLTEIGRPLVMTSGNRTDEPIAFTDDDALARLGDIADLFLTHDRPIETRCDDSVMRVDWGGPTFLRRSRGFAPQPIRLDMPFPVPVLAVGGHLKNTFCFGKGRYAFLSHHIGDLENPAAYQALKEGVAHYSRLFDVHPDIVAHDLHRDYLSTQLAEEFDGPERVPVQHHHAHVASCMAEHGVSEPVIGVAFDGSGLGTDGAIWGGEFLLAEGAGYQRLAHLGYVLLPGGDAAVRQPWRMGAAHLWAAYGGEIERLSIPFLEDLDPGAWSLLKQMLIRGVNSPPTSSIGRLFDAVAALLDVRRVAQYEAQAAMELEMVADPDTRGSYPVDIQEDGDGWVVDTAPLIRGVVSDVAAGCSTPQIAGAFHNAICDLIVHVVEHIGHRTGVRRVALTGGAFQNALLTERTADALVIRGFEVLLHRRVPCNDGGLSLGQAFVAALAGGSARNAVASGSATTSVISAASAAPAAVAGQVRRGEICA